MLRRAAELRPSRLYVFMSGQRDGKVPGFVLGGKVQGSSARAHNLEASYQRLRRPQPLA